MCDVTSRHHSPRPMRGPTLFNDHSHDDVLVGLSPLLVRANNLIYADIADQITRDEDKVAGDDPVSVDIAHGISRRERLLGGHDGDDL